jgi:predicted branched-subunit amino acid permease
VNSERRAQVRLAQSQGIQVALAVSLTGISFGALSVASGFSLGQTMVLSLLMFSGASQFALIGILSSGGGAAALSAIASAALLGMRNGLYALRMSSVVGPGWLKRLIAAHWTIDESTAVATAQTSLEASRAGFWTTGAGVFLGWNLATLSGALVGDVLGDVRSFGLDAAAAAAFLGLVWPRLREGEPAAVAAASAVLTAVLLPVLPVGWPILVIALATIVFALYRHRVAPLRATREESA